MPHRRIWTAPNLLTMARLAFVPVFCWVTTWSSVAGAFTAIAVFLIASITDHYDGKLARRRNEITDFGTLADPIADKALTGAAFIVLSLQGTFPWWATAVVLVREWGITVWRLTIRHRAVHAASFGGKLKTTLQIAAITLALWPQTVPAGEVVHLLGVLALWAAFAVTLWTGFTYARELRTA